MTLSDAQKAKKSDFWKNLCKTFKNIGKGGKSGQKRRDGGNLPEPGPGKIEAGNSPD